MTLWFQSTMIHRLDIDPPYLDNLRRLDLEPNSSGPLLFDLSNEIGTRYFPQGSIILCAAR
jgi:hypothetical protein